LIDAPVDFTVLCDTVRNSFGCGHLTIWFVHFSGRAGSVELPGVRLF
jgi:hypothetical protein